MKAIFLASALLLTATLSQASAAPVAPMSIAPSAIAPGVERPLVDVQYNRDRDDRNYRREAPRYRNDGRYNSGPRYRAGGRYNSAPRGWHRYDRRPGDWSRRGCILVGPVWACP
jgi:hypothetical protein